MTIGIAIPTYIGHIELLDRLLDSIEESTILPTQVSISMSETIWLPMRNYPFDIIITHSDIKQNVARNSNIALSKLSTDILSVIGGDDMTHPQRNEFILSAFENEDTDVVVHNFLQSSEVDWLFLRNRYNRMELYVNYIDTLFPNIPYPTSAIKHLDFANGFVSFRRKIFDQFKYDESPEMEYKEDSFYNRKLVESGIKISYIKQKLVLYLKNPFRAP